MRIADRGLRNVGYADIGIERRSLGRTEDSSSFRQNLPHSCSAIRDSHPHSPYPHFSLF